MSTNVASTNSPSFPETRLTWSWEDSWWIKPHAVRETIQDVVFHGRGSGETSSFSKTHWYHASYVVYDSPPKVSGQLPDHFSFNSFLTVASLPRMKDQKLCKISLCKCLAQGIWVALNSFLGLWPPLKKSWAELRTSPSLLPRPAKPLPPEIDFPL